MRILQINKLFYERGGAEAVFFSTINGLKARGHDVGEFSMRSPHNLPSDFNSFFATELPDLSKKHDWLAAWKVFFQSIYSADVGSKLKALVIAVEPEVAHLHNVYHQLSAGVFSVLKRKKIPIVMTVHDVQPMCPNHRMVRGTDNTLCEHCFKHRYYNSVRFRCASGRFFPNVAQTLEMYYYYLRGIWEIVDIFICPSQFMLDKMLEWGFPMSKLRLIRHPFTVPEACPPLGDKVAFLGRLHQEKGIRFLMSALSQLRNLKTIIAGYGPESYWVDTFIRQNSLTNVSRREWITGEARTHVLADARVVVVPSLFYENCSMVILEALGNGRLVVAADRGGNRELIKNGETGFLVKPENPDALAAGIRAAMELPAAEADRIRSNGRELVAKNHSLENYLDEIERVYREAIGIHVIPTE